MRTDSRRLIIALLLALAALAPGLRAESPNREEVAVLKADRARLDAMLAADADAVARALADDCLYVHSYGAVQTKSEFVEAFRKRTLAYRKMAYVGEPRVRLVSRDVAVVTGEMQLEVVNAEGRLLKPALLLTAIYVRARDGWKLVSYQSTPASQAAR